MGDDAKPVQERLTYARRLQTLDPANAECKRLVNSLLGKDEEPAPQPRGTPDAKQPAAEPKNRDATK